MTRTSKPFSWNLRMLVCLRVTRHKKENLESILLCSKGIRVDIIIRYEAVDTLLHHDLQVVLECPHLSLDLYPCLLDCCSLESFNKKSSIPYITSYRFIFPKHKETADDETFFFPHTYVYISTQSRFLALWSTFARDVSPQLTFNDTFSHRNYH